MTAPISTAGDMTQPVALVTGGARRIGRAIVEDLAANGFAVAIHCHGSCDEADALAATIAGQGGRAMVVEAELADSEALTRLVSEAAQALGPIRLLVNNASAFVEDSIAEFDEAAWAANFDANLRAPVALTAAFAKALPQDDEGLVVNVIDQRVWRLRPDFLSYTLSKAALWTATQTLAMALAPRIRVNAIGPGPSLRGERQTEADFDKQLAAVILRRGPSLGEFGAAIRYLWQARSVTGQMIALDGGQHLAWQTPDVTGIVE